MAEPIHVADPYRALGVARSATDAEIKAAHRTLAKRFHPDTDGGDTRRFLRVQEAYRVLSDPLLRREWDARHAPGPIRADRAERAARAPRQPRQRAQASAEPEESTPRPDPRRQPRTSRAYTWSAGEVPWWEDRGKETKRRTRRPAQDRHQDEPAQPSADAPDSAPHDEPHDVAHDEPPNEFDVYNRSSGAAWSMAARAYFRRGDQELPRRGSFHHQGSQPLTAARARTAAEQEARRRAAAAAFEPQTAAPRGTPPRGTPPRAAPQRAATPAATVQQARERIVRRAVELPWPTMAQRLVYALVAWLPFAVLIALAGTATIAGARVPVDEVIQAVLMALVLGIFFAIPRLAYVAGVATVGLLGIGALLIGALVLLGVGLPLNAGLTAAIGAALALGYVATAGIVALGPAALRPWSRAPQTVRNR